MHLEPIRVGSRHCGIWADRSVFGVSQKEPGRQIKVGAHHIKQKSQCSCPRVKGGSDGNLFVACPKPRLIDVPKKIAENETESSVSSQRQVLSE